MQHKIKNELVLFFRQILKDNQTNTYSQAKVISLLGFVCLTVFMWQLIIVAAMSIEYFVGYAAYCAGNLTVNKWLDGRNRHLNPDDQSHRTE